jgi:glycine/D-amino acid oxidase-like deaminating enzyme
VEIGEMSPVTALGQDAGAWTATTPEGSVRAPMVMLAVNGHAESFGFFRGRLLHVFTYASMTRALSPGEVSTLGGVPNWACTPAEPIGTTVRRVSGIGGDRIVIRNRFTCDPSMEVPDGRLAAIARSHDRAFRKRFPMLEGVGMEYRWGARLCISRNDVPAFGEVAEGLYAACCQNGLGTVRGTVAGMLAAEMATGCRSDLLDRILYEASPARLPPEPAARIGATLTIRWRELRAGAEL